MAIRWVSALAVVVLLSGTAAGHGFGLPCHKKPPCSDCQVHFHVCKTPGVQAAQQAAQQAPAAQPYQAARLLPSTAAYAMPMMPVMAAYYPQQPQRSSDGCGACASRIERLEDGVRNLSDRMDRIEAILENQTRALTGIRDVLQERGLLND